MKNHKTQLIALLFIGVFFMGAALAFSPAAAGIDEETPMGILEEEDGVEDQEDEEDEEDNDEDDDDVDDDFEAEHERSVEVEISDNEIQIESELKNGNQKNEFDVKVQFEDKLKIELEFEEDIEDTDTEFEVEFGVEFKKIVEYLDTDNDSLYNEDVDTTLTEYNFGNWAPVEYTPTTQADGSTLHYILIRTSDSVFAAHLYVVGEFMDLNTTVLAPTEIKIDIEINNFSFTDPDSRLALYTKMESEYEYEYDDETESEEEGYAEREAGLVSEMGNFAAGFSWAEFVLVDGVELPVFVGAVEKDDDDENHEKIYINYPQGNNIFHDPKIGVLGLINTAPSFLEMIPGYPAWIMLAVSSLVLGAMGLRKYKKVASIH